MAPSKLLSCFTSPGGGSRDGARLDATLPSIEVQRINSSKAFEHVLQRANSRGRTVLVEWAANWCSLCLQADFEFAHLAAKLALEQPGRLKLVRVNLDKEEDLALRYKVFTLPSFSIFQDGQLMEHYTGLESCQLMYKRLQTEQSCQGSSDMPMTADLSRAIPDIVTCTSKDSVEWDNCASSVSSDGTAYAAETSPPEQRSTSLEWNAFAPSQYLTRYNRTSLEDMRSKEALRIHRRHQRGHSAS